MVYSTYKKQWILYVLVLPRLQASYDQEGAWQGNLKCSRVGIYKFLKSYNAIRSICRRIGSGRPSKITAEIKQLVEQQMRIDDETTAYQLHRMLTEKGYSISLRTILRCRTALGWTFRGSAYCQFEKPINRSDFSGHSNTLVSHLRMSYGPMKAWSRWRATVGLLAENVERRLDPSPGNCYMYSRLGRVELTTPG